MTAPSIHATSRGDDGVNHHRPNTLPRLFQRLRHEGWVVVATMAIGSQHGCGPPSHNVIAVVTSWSIWKCSDRDGKA